MKTKTEKIQCSNHVPTPERVYGTTVIDQTKPRRFYIDDVLSPLSPQAMEIDNWYNDHEPTPERAYGTTIILPSEDEDEFFNSINDDDGILFTP